MASLPQPPTKKKNNNKFKKTRKKRNVTEEKRRGLKSGVLFHDEAARQNIGHLVKFEFRINKEDVKETDPEM